MVKLILGKEIVEKEIYPKLRRKIGIKNPFLVIFYNPKDELGTKYIQIKKAAAKKTGIRVKLEPYHNFKDDLAKVHQFNQDKKVTGILLQLPLPKGYSPELIYTLNPFKDVDGLSSKFFIAPVVKAVERALHEIPNWQEKSILVAGQGEFVGKKIYTFLKRTVPNIQAVDNEEALDALLPKFDIVVSCVGKANLINKHNFKGKMAIDVGTMVEKGKIKGDISPDLIKKLDYLAPVPGGIGPMTIGYLAENIWEAKEKFQN